MDRPGALLRGPMQAAIIFRARLDVDTPISSNRAGSVAQIDHALVTTVDGREWGNAVGRTYRGIYKEKDMKNHALSALGMVSSPPVTHRRDAREEAEPMRSSSNLLRGGSALAA